MDIPEPDDSGTAGKQLINDGKVDLVPQQPIGSFTETMVGLAAAHPSKLGGQIGSQVLTAIVVKLEKDAQLNTDKITSLRERLDSANDQLNTWKIKAKVLSERLLSARRIRLGGNFLITIGITVLGLAINSFEKEIIPKSYGTILVVLGLISTFSGWLIGWLTGSGGEDDT